MPPGARALSLSAAKVQTALAKNPVSQPEVGWNTESLVQ
jgi:hypothetical protein